MANDVFKSSAHYQDICLASSSKESIIQSEVELQDVKASQGRKRVDTPEFNDENC